jgi:hypothetical protein
MSGTPWITLCFYLLVVCGPLQAGQPLQTLAPDNAVDATVVESPRDLEELHLSDRGRAAVDKAIDEVIECAKQAGHNDQVAKWQSQRGQPITIHIIRDLADACDDLVGCNELRSAQRLGTELETIANAVKDENDGVFALIQIKLCFLDSECERYESAISRMDAWYRSPSKRCTRRQFEIEIITTSWSCVFPGQAWEIS